MLDYNVVIAMSQNLPDSDTVRLGDDESLLRDVYEHVRKLESRVDELESHNDQLTNQNEELEQTATTLKKKVTTLETENATLQRQVETLAEDLETLTSRMNSTSSRADVLYDEITQAQEDLTDQAFHSEERTARLTKRVAGIEEELGLEDWETASTLTPNACALERFSLMPEARRKKELNAPVFRATIVWAHFDEWSKPTRKGRVIRSGELRKLLKAQTGRKFAWTQVYRVMEEFKSNTTSQYDYIKDSQTDEESRNALIRLRNFGGNV
jgi:prefoldin subunit 5